MAEERRAANGLPPESPTAIALSTGMGAPGLADVRGTLEEALVFPPVPLNRANPEGDGVMDDADDLIPGQSGAEALAELPNARPEDPWDGP